MRKSVDACLSDARAYALALTIILVGLMLAEIFIFRVKAHRDVNALELTDLLRAPLFLVLAIMAGIARREIVRARKGLMFLKDAADRHVARHG